MNHQRRIAFLLGSFPVISETFILRQITGLLDMGYDVRIYSNDKPEERGPVHAEVEKHQLMNRTVYVRGPRDSIVWELPLKPLSGKTWPPGAAKPTRNWQRFLSMMPARGYCLRRAPKLARSVIDPREYGYQAESGSGIYRLATLCRESRAFDVLHAHFGPVGNSFRFARELFRAPLVVSFHGYDFSTLPRKQGATIYEKLFQTADLISVNSEFTRAEVLKLGCPAEKLRLLPVGLNLTEFKFRERSLSSGDPVRLISVARLTEIKGHETILRAVAVVSRSGRQMRYDVVGDGPLRKKLQGLALELGINEFVVFHGSLRGDEISKLLDQAHLFLLCSVSVDGDQEGQGLAMQEAQACGLPVIATRHGALPEGLLAGESGYLVPERDPETLANRIQFLIENSGKWAEMGRAGRNFVKDKYDIQKLNENLAAIYTEAIDAFRNHG